MYQASDLPEVSGDTGWFPSGSPAQLRITGRIVGETTVAMSLAPTACWDSGMSISAPGQPQTGLLDSEYGAELQVLGKIHVSVLGVTKDWQGPVPLPYWIPTNLLMAGTTAFDPAALPDSSQPLVSVTSNPTSQIRVLQANVLSDFIPIPGVGGDLYIAVQGELTTSYHTTAIQLAQGSIASATGAVSVNAPEAGFAGSLAAPIAASGVVRYDPTLIFSAHFNVTIIGIQVANWTIATVDMPLPGFDRDVTLQGAGLTFALPHLDPAPNELGFASGSSQMLTLHDAGGAPLVVSVQSAPSGVTAATLTVAPGQDGMLQVSAADPSALGGQPLVLATNDPDHATISITLDPTGTGQGNEGVEHGGGCQSGRGGSFALVVVVLGLVLHRGCARRAA